MMTALASSLPLLSPRNPPSISFQMDPSNCLLRYTPILWSTQFSLSDKGAHPEISPACELSWAPTLASAPCCSQAVGSRERLTRQFYKVPSSSGSWGES